MLRTLGLLMTALCCSAATAQEDLLLYAPMDGSAEPVLGAVGAKAESAGDLTFPPGMLGQSLDLTADCRYDLGSLFPIESGTFALWVKPHWRAPDPVTHYLMCVYGDPSAPESWCHDRWSVDAAGGKVGFSVYSHEGGNPRAVSASIADWQPGSWHHVAVTWEGLNTGPGKAALRLYLDGKLAAEAGNLEVKVSRPSSRLDLGRDSDGSPDYGEALFDEVFVYRRALTREEIAAGVERVEGGQPLVAKPAGVRLGSVPGWLDAGRPFRAFLENPPVEGSRTDASLEIPLDLGGDLRQLGLRAEADPSTFRLVEVSRTGGSGAGGDRPLSVDEGHLSWVAPGATAAGAVRRFALYFDVVGYEYLGPLLVARGQPRGEAPHFPQAAPKDYATTAYGDAWDFDEGDAESIDRFGDKDAYFRNIRAENGALMASVSQDPYLIWGSMWGPEDKGQRRVRIDVDEYSVLEMRVRQSVPSAQWALYGRLLGTDQLLVHHFTVSGQSWQKVRIDLVNEARWGGTLSAFRIDPTEEVDADIAIDWVKLLAVQTARRTPVGTLGSPSSTPAHLALALAEAQPEVGREQALTVRVTDATNRPVAGCPVRVALAKGSGGELQPAAQPLLRTEAGGLRGLTDAKGEVTLAYRASGKAATPADTLVAATEFPPVEAKPIAVATRPGPPHHYLVLSDKVTIWREGKAPFPITAQAVDAFGNPLRLAGRRLTWTVEEGRLADASASTDAVGAAKASFAPDMARRWVYTIGVKDDRGLRGESGPVCVLPRGPRADPVRLGRNGYFATADGKAYLPLGGFYINWVGLPDLNTGEEGRIIRSFTDATEEQTLHWLEHLHRQGVTTLRFMLRTHGPRGMEPMDIGGRVNRALLARALRLMDLARRYDLRFLLVLHDDYDKPVYCHPGNLEAFSLPRFAGEDLDRLPPYQRRFIRDRRLLRQAREKYTDPDAIACQDDYAREIVSYVKDNPQLFGYELENEMVECPREWAAHAVQVIRSVDSVTPICVSHGGGGLHTADPLWWTTKTPIDFYTYHLYPVGTTTQEADYGIGVSMLARYGRMAGVCFLGESSGDEFSVYPAERDGDRRYLMRDIIWMSLVNGNPGCFFWNARGYEVEEFRLAHEIAGRIDWTTWQREKPSIAVLVSHDFADDKHYRTPQGTADRATMARYSRHYLAAGVDFDFALSPTGYAQTADLSAFRPPEPAARPFSVSPGFELASLTRAGATEGLIYVRNVASTRSWQVSKVGTMWLRDRKAAPLQIALSLPAEKLAVRWFDLDTGASAEKPMPGRATLDLGTTEHDFAIHWKR